MIMILSNFRGGGGLGRRFGGFATTHENNSFAARNPPSPFFSVRVGIIPSRLPARAVWAILAPPIPLGGEISPMGNSYTCITSFANIPFVSTP